jgi:coenzyme F420-reducing hydrogenase delta subunit
MSSPAKNRPTYTVEAIPTDIANGILLGNSSIDKIVSCMIAIGTELWATQRRLKVIEAVMAKNGITHEMIEQYVPSAEEAAAWERDRDRFVDLTFSPLGDDGIRPASADFPHRG